MEASFKRASDVVATLFGRRLGGAEHHTLEVPEPALPLGWPAKLPFRKRPKPYARAIAWTPADHEGSHPADRPYELFVSQSVLSEVRQHLITATSGEPFGFLIGQVVYCPWSEAPYIVVDSVRRETENLPSANDLDRFRHAWVAATRDARHRRGVVIGWYHRHGVLGLRLSEWDLRLQEEFFAEDIGVPVMVPNPNEDPADPDDDILTGILHELTFPSTRDQVACNPVPDLPDPCPKSFR